MAMKFCPAVLWAASYSYCDHLRVKREDLDPAKCPRIAIRDELYLYIFYTLSAFWSSWSWAPDGDVIVSSQQESSASYQAFRVRKRSWWPLAISTSKCMQPRGLLICDLSLTSQNHCCCKFALICPILRFSCDLLSVEVIGVCFSAVCARSQPVWLRSRLAEGCFVRFSDSHHQPVFRACYGRGTGTASLYLGLTEEGVQAWVIMSALKSIRRGFESKNKLVAYRLQYSKSGGNQCHLEQGLFTYIAHKIRWSKYARSAIFAETGKIPV